MENNTITATLACVGLAMILSLGTLSAQIIYVSEGATGDGSSWENATGDLRAALAASKDGGEVRVSGGTYTPTTCSPCTFADRDKRFVLPKGVKLRGNFVNASPGGVFRVILSGQIDPNVDSTRSFTVLESIAPTEGTLIEHIDFRYGLANDTTRGSSNRGASGSLLHVSTTDTLEAMKLEIRDCNFEYGEAIRYGGAVFVDADHHKKSQLKFAHCYLENNTAGSGGGAMAISSSFGGIDNSELFEIDIYSNTSGDEGGGGLLLRAAEGGTSNASFEHVYFDQNTTAGGNGGGLRLYGKGGDCSPTIKLSDFSSNSAEFGGGLAIEGGYNGISNPVLKRCEFFVNESINAGGAIYASAIYGGTADFKIYESILSANESGESGGAILVNAIEGSSKALYRDVEFNGNVATLYGGAIYNLGKSGICSPTLVNCAISNNRASSAGGMYCLGSEGGESSPLILNSVFADNWADVGGALYSNANDSTGTAEPFVANTAFFYNFADNGQTLRTIHGRPHFLNCYFDETDTQSLNSGSGGEAVFLEGNIFEEDQEIFDFDRNTHPFNPLADGALIDAGNDSILIANGVFLDGAQSARFRGNQVDIGLIESTSASILWDLAVDSTEVSACEGSTVTLGATIYPPYPGIDVNWIIGSDTVSQGASYTINDVTSSQTIEVSGSLFGESRNLTIAVNAVPTLETSLTIDATNLPDTLCIDSSYQLQATPVADGADYSVKWFDENQTLLAETETITITPSSNQSLTRTVVAEYAGACLDTSSRSSTVDFDVVNCMVSNTLQATDFKDLIVFPNPTRDNISLMGLSGNGPYDYQIHSSTGQTVNSGTMSASNTTLNVYSLPQGLYFLIVRDEQTIYRVLLEKL